MHLGALGRAPATFAGDDFKIARLAACGADDQRLQNALLADRISQVAERLIAKVTARLERVRDELRNRHHAKANSGAFRFCRRGGRRRACCSRRGNRRLRRGAWRFRFSSRRGPGAGIDRFLSGRNIGAVLTEQRFQATAKLARAGFFVTHRVSPVRSSASSPAGPSGGRSVFLA